MQTNKPLPHLTIRSGPWAGTMVRFATVEQLRAVQQYARLCGVDSSTILQGFFEHYDLRLNAPKPQQSNQP